MSISNDDAMEIIERLRAASYVPNGCSLMVITLHDAELIVDEQCEQSMLT